MGVLSDGQLQWKVDEAVHYLELNGAVERNYQRWDQGSGFDYEAQIEMLKSYLRNRSQWMDGEISAL
jgi:hypothetical protein